MNWKGQTFPYPGGKTLLAPWIVDHFTDHECYVELFGGSASVLATKQKSEVEVYNDMDGDLVHFFETVRDREDELIEYIKQTPAAREIHDRWGEAYYNGERPSDDVERAARFFYLRYTQYGAFYKKKNGFRVMNHRSVGAQMNRGASDLHRLADRLRDVVIECGDYADVIGRYDGEETLFYADPPYVSEGDGLYRHGEFDHSRFADEIQAIEGDFIVSYYDFPKEFTPEHSVKKDTEVDAHRAGTKTKTEQLGMSYDPKRSPKHTELEQQTL